MKLKRIIAGLTSMVMLGSLAGCGGGTVAPEVAPQVTTAAAGGDTTTAGGDAGAADTTAAPENAVPTLQELYGDETIEITVFSQLANYSGKLTGWFAEVMKREFNCEMTIIPDTDGMFDTRMESGDLGDIVIFGSNGDQYQRAVKEGMLYDLNEDDLLTNYGAYLQENMPYALENNANLNESVSGEKVMHGFGHNVASSPDDHEAFFYTMDVRWDLYKELGYPEINNLDEFYQLMVDMKGICPTDENGNETYATSLWPDWDGNMVMYVKAFATCYWGYDEMGFGLYDVENGDFHYALEENGPYLESLKFFNKLYQAGLIDPNSMTQTYNEMSEKVTAGGTFFSIFDYAGSQLYNTENHLTEGKAMYPMVPNDATPLCYGMNVLGGNRIWTIGANTEYPELCMAIINYLTTPEGYMTYNYGPKDLCWYYDEEGNSCLTELGAAAQADRKGTIMPDEWGGGNFNDGTFQANNTTWSKDASNPDSNGETYNYINWKSQRKDETYDILQDWRDKYGQYTSQDYMNTTNFKVALGTPYTESKRTDDLKIIWEQVAECLVNYTWQAIYAESDEEYDRIVNEMITKCGEYDPDGLCLAWCEEEAKIRCALEDQVR
ncbi:MAG: extracellular solute-binding protein [Oscillospiraceae bacterium]|nr:extracellular solute-binding protein [Oscillospiraceae bacterium]